MNENTLYFGSLQVTVSRHQLHMRYDIRGVFTDTWHFFDFDTVTSLLQTCIKTSLPSVESRLKRVENAQSAVLLREQ